MSGARIPLANLPSKGDANAEGNSDEDINFTSSLGVSGMHNTLSACVNNNDTALKSDSSPEESNAGVIQFSSTGQPLPVPSNSAGPPSYLRSTSENRTYVEGSLVLAFAGSHTSEKVHCVDVTVRCNPIHHLPSSVGKSSDGGTGSDGSKNIKLTTSSRTMEAGRAIDNQESEELDGWRGYFRPFAHDTHEQPVKAVKANSESSASLSINPSSNAAPSTTPSSFPKFPRVVGVAICSDSKSHGSNYHEGKSIYVACITDAENSVGVTVHRDPHLYLNTALKPDVSSSSSRIKPNKPGENQPNASMADSKVTPKAEVYQPVGAFDYSHRGRPKCVDISYESGIVVVGTDNGMVLVYKFSVSSNTTSVMAGSNGTNKMNLMMEIPSPSASSGHAASCVRIISESVNVDSSNSSTAFGLRKNPSGGQAYNSKIFVTYRRCSASGRMHGDKKTSNGASKNTSIEGASSIPNLGSKSVGGGVCCYDIGVLKGSTSSNISPSARYDLDGRDVASNSLCDIVVKRVADDKSDGNSFMVARSDGLYTYSSNDKLSVSPIDGTKIAMCSIPPQQKTRTRSIESGASYFLVAATDSKSGRDAVDIYDATNKLVAFHILLSPGHKALRASATTTISRTLSDGNARGGLSAAIILTSGGSVVTLIEKVTTEKVSLLVQKNLYSAAISMAFADPSYQPSDITGLYRKHAEHLYRKGDFSAAMDQYIYTIGSLEPSYVIFRYLDAPKIPLLAKYLEELRSRDLATPVQNELLRTCYLKLNDVNAAEKISASLSKTLDSSSCISLVSKLLHNPTEALTMVCSLEAPQAAEALTLHGDTLARALPRETAGVVISLCDGAYSPSSLAELADRGKRNKNEILKEKLESGDDQPKVCETYTVSLFSSAFIENPKLLRVILAHCHKNKRELSQSLKRTLLELTLEEWNNSKRMGDMELESKRRAEAISILTDPHSNDLGDYEALVIVQLANFSEGEVLLYERLQMTPMLVEKYAKDGTYKARRQMLAMCRSDPELLADVLGYFVTMASEKAVEDDAPDAQSTNSETDLDEILDDINEALSLARAQGVLPPVRIARILAGDGVGQFSNEKSLSQRNDFENGVPLSVSLDYIGSILDESSNDIKTLKCEVQEYSQMCNAMECEIESLLSPSRLDGQHKKSSLQVVNIEEMYSTLLQSNPQHTNEKKTEASSEEFWREIGHSEDRFETISRFFAKGIIE